MKVSVIGTGYVGLVSGACLAERGHEVICVDVDPHKVGRINAARPPFHEHGLAELLAREIGRRRSATTDLTAAVLDTDVTFIAVGTPATDGRIDLRDVESAARAIGKALARKSRDHTVIVKSTVIPGTTAGLVRTAHRAFPLDYAIQPQPNIALTRNRSVEMATGEWLAFIDDDERAPHQSLSRLLKAAATHAADGVLGPVEPQVPDTAPRWLRRGRFYDFPHQRTGAPVSLNCMRFGYVLLRAGLQMLIAAALAALTLPFGRHRAGAEQPLGLAHHHPPPWPRDIPHEPDRPVHSRPHGDGAHAMRPTSHSTRA